jgi:hypothetical protein
MFSCLRASALGRTNVLIFRTPLEMNKPVDLVPEPNETPFVSRVEGVDTFLAGGVELWVCVPGVTAGSLEGLRLDLPGE